jgi:RNA polymerase sigma-70 factor (ECF subfamily)
MHRVSTEDEVLTERAKSGDREAFGALVRKHQRRVYATAFQIMGNHSDADDVAQEALVRAWRGLGRFDGRADLFTWLYRIVVNVALNALRARKRLPEAPLGADAAERALAEHVAPAPRPDATAQDRELTAKVLAALGELSDSLRVTLVLATVEGLPYRTIAELLGVPEGTVAWRINQARHMLRQRLATVGALAGSPLGAASESEEGHADDVLRRTKPALGTP